MTNTTALLTPSRLQGFALKRADDFTLGDIIVVPAPWTASDVGTVTVRQLELVGDDVEVNDGMLSTSQGNVFVVLDR